MKQINPNYHLEDNYNNAHDQQRSDGYLRDESSLEGEGTEEYLIFIELFEQFFAFGSWDSCNYFGATVFTWKRLYGRLGLGDTRCK